MTPPYWKPQIQGTAAPLCYWPVVTGHAGSSQTTLLATPLKESTAPAKPQELADKATTHLLPWFLRSPRLLPLPVLPDLWNNRQHESNSSRSRWLPTDPGVRTTAAWSGLRERPEGDIAAGKRSSGSEGKGFHSNLYLRAALCAWAGQKK